MFWKPWISFKSTQATGLMMAFTFFQTTLHLRIVLQNIQNLGGINNLRRWLSKTLNSCAIAWLYEEFDQIHCTTNHINWILDCFVVPNFCQPILFGNIWLKFFQLIFVFSQFDLPYWSFDKYAAPMQEYSSNYCCPTLFCSFKFDSQSPTNRGNGKEIVGWHCWKSISSTDGESAREKTR